ncbi:MAG: hypothetical protein UW69_C0052G0003 [Microgenomates group bacterium GW2011_GWA2_44_7]|nr:MAG: hypothetical protein UW69_C0052G0003 [Microgenomates group bacterium GW2011_GWA2_44_7]
MALAMWTYHAERLMVPLFATALFVIFHKEIGKLKRAVLVMAIATGVVLAPLVYLLTTQGGTARFSSVFIGRDVAIQSELHKTEKNQNAIQTLLDNNALTLFNFWSKRYLNYWDLGFIFFNGMGLTGPGEPDVGLFHLVEIVPFLIGLAVLLLGRSGLDRRRKRLVVVWLLLGPLAASLANNDQHPLRSLTAIPAPQILVGIGVFWLWGWFRTKTKLARRVFVAVSAGLMVSALLYYLDLYYNHAPIRFSEFDGYGLKQAAIYAIQNHNLFKEVVFDPTFGTLGPFTESLPHLYILFYSQYDPWRYQRDLRRIEYGGSSNFANFNFRPIYWPKDRYLKDRLFIGSPWSLPKNDLLGFGQILQTIPFKNGASGFVIVRTSE